MRARYYRQRRIERSPLRQFFDWMLVLTLGGLLVFVIVRLDEVSAQQAQGFATVVDGDSLLLQGQKLRLEGIDAPEYLQTCKVGAQIYSCGKQARKHLEQLVGKQKLDCKGWQHDKYGRLLVRCLIANGELNKQMVLSGWAIAYGDYFAEESAAREGKRGIWQGDFERPSVWRKMRGDVTEVPHDIWLKISTFFKKLFAL